MPESGGLPRVLFVDDEELVVQALERQVRGMVAAEVVTSPQVAAGRLAEAGQQPDGGFAAVVCDMRMPAMNGAALLAHARQVCPDTTRLLLTGYADIDSAIAAVNDGAVFRFLTKPCSAPVLRAALGDAVSQHWLIRDQRELLERTLRGAVEALVETLAMTHPQAFSRASRLRRLTQQVGEQLGLAQRWQVEIAAQLAEVGVVTLPPEALEALTRGTSPNAVVARMIHNLPETADRLLAGIPRLEDVRAIVRAQQPVDHLDSRRLAGADQPTLLVQAVREYDALTTRDYLPTNAIGVLRHRPHHDPAILDALAAVVVANDDDATDPRVDPSCCPGMVLAADLRVANGMLLVSHGHVLTEDLLSRIRNFAKLSGLDGRPLVRTPAPTPDAPTPDTSEVDR
jgi:response regulator RpfG family c-di-GMP phosphodiesterase